MELNSDSCFFCRIVAGRAEASVVYDDITSARLGYIEGGEIKYDVERLAKPSREELNKMARLLS